MSTSPVDLSRRREDFPALQRIHNGRPLAYLDGPAGTQVPLHVIGALTSYYATCNANTHGTFVTSVESDRLLDEARTVAATFLGAQGGHTISFGANMTTLTYSLSRAIARALRPGDEVVITELDHEANRGPWLTLQEHGITVREIALLRDGTLDHDDFRAKIGAKTRLVAMGLASNALGTVNDVALARELSRRAGAWLMVDAVHYAPHFSVDVCAMDVDFLICSAYKFYGPHVGLLYAREGLLDRLQTDRLVTQDPEAPYRIETGTLNHAAILGVKAAIEYIASLGEGQPLRHRLVSALERIGAHERDLASRLHRELGRINGVTLYGPSFEVPRRAPTVSFTVKGHTATEVCARLAEMGICTWDGHFYALRAIEKLGLLENGGVTRVGFALYNTDEEVERLLDVVRLL